MSGPTQARVRSLKDLASDVITVWLDSVILSDQAKRLNDATRRVAASLDQITDKKLEELENDDNEITTLEISYQRLNDATRQLAAFLDQFTDKKLEELEKDDNEIAPLENSYHSNEAQRCICLRSYIDENVADEELEMAFCQLLLGIVHCMIPRDTGRIRTINLLHVSLPGRSLPDMWQVYWDIYFRSAITSDSSQQRDGELILKRLKVTYYLNDTKYHLAAETPENYVFHTEHKLRNWMQKKIPVRLEALTVGPTDNYYTCLPGLQSTQTLMVESISLKHIHLNGEGVKIAVVPPLLDKDQLQFITTVFNELCPGSLLLDPLPHQYLLNGSTVATAINKLQDYWCGNRESGFHSLIALVHCVGSFREDVMRAINNAISEGIIVVCPAGMYADHISFPASMGSVICVGAADEKGNPTVYSPSGREIDWLVQPIKGVSEDEFELKATGNAATVAVSFIALLCSRIGRLQLKNNIMHTAVIKEVLKETTQFRTHKAKRGYGLITENVFSFSDSKLTKILNSITTAASSLSIAIPAESLEEQCKHNTEMFSNRKLNERMDVGVTLTGNGIRIAVIDDDFPEQFLGEYRKGVELKEEITKFNANAAVIWKPLEKLAESLVSVQDATLVLEENIPEHFEEAKKLIKSLEKTTGELETDMGELSETIGKKYRQVHASHGLQCVLVLENIVPDANMLLLNSLGLESTDLADTIVKHLLEDKRPDILICSMAFDNFNPKLAEAINTAINKGVIPIFTAGNTGQTSRNTISYPAKLGNAICIGAHSWYGAVQGFSSFGREVDFLAPGEFMILDKHPVSGTSFAAPAAAAMVALILEYTMSKAVVEEASGAYAQLKMWHEYPPESGNWQWEMTPIHKACQNVYVMRQLLRQISLDPTTHVHGSGHGLLDITRLAIDLSPADLHRTLQNFHIRSKHLVESVYCQ